MRISTQDQRPGHGKTIFEKDLVTDTMLDIKEMHNTLPGDKFPDGFMIQGVRFGSGRDNMIKDDHDLLGNFHILDSEFFEFLDNSGRVVMRKNIIWRNSHHVSGRNFLTGFLSQNFF